MTAATIDTQISDPINAKILAFSEDKLQGFHADPIAEIARQSGVDAATVIERIQAMLRAGTIRRVRQTLMATNLATGALVAWQVPEEKLSAAFDFMFQRDPFSGHVVIRTTDAGVTQTRYRLWTTLKVPQGYSLLKHAQFPGSKSDELAEVICPEIVKLSELDWRVLTALKREFTPEEIQLDIWKPRAAEAGVDLPTFLKVGQSLNQRGVIGRFSTFLEHVKPNASGERVTKFNALFHWAVPPGREIDTGREVGRFHIMTHAYWREGGPEFANVNVMGVAHGLDKQVVLQHKAAIDEHLASVGIPVTYTNVFWGGRSEIKPSEISPVVYEQWCRENGIDPATMRE